MRREVRKAIFGENEGSESGMGIYSMMMKHDHMILMFDQEYLMILMLSFFRKIS